MNLFLRLISVLLLAAFLGLPGTWEPINPQQASDCTSDSLQKLHPDAEIDTVISAETGMRRPVRSSIRFKSVTPLPHLPVLREVSTLGQAPHIGPPAPMAPLVVEKIHRTTVLII